MFYQKSNLLSIRENSIILSFFVPRRHTFLSFFTQTNIYEIIVLSHGPSLKKSHILLIHYLELVFQNKFQKILISNCQKRQAELEPFIIMDLLFTPRTDGGIAMSIYCAELFSKNKKFINDYCIEVDADSKPFVEQGKSVFCQHVKKMWF